MPDVRILTLLLDDEDYAAVQAAMAARQLFRWPRKAGAPQGTILPEGDSDLAGALIAEICRDWIDGLDRQP